MRAERFATQMKALRETRRWSQTHLAEMAGVPASSISHFESGRRAPALATLLRIATAFDISLDVLVYGDRADELRGNVR